MDTTLSYLALALSAATLLVTIYLAIRLKAVHYLLQQPVVKKMSPQLRLKPVKLDEALDRNRNRERQGGRDGERSREGRPERREGRPERRDGERGREGRSERGEGRPERREGERSREGRPERREGRPDGERRDGREGRAERGEGRPERREGREGREGERRDDRRPPRDFNENREAPAQPAHAAPAAETGSGLPPRRPLPTFSDSPVERSEASASVPAADTFVGSGDDVQHGRRTQLKKKPRFDFDETETPPAL